MLECTRLQVRIQYGNGMANGQISMWLFLKLHVLHFFSNSKTTSPIRNLIPVSWGAHKHSHGFGVVTLTTLTICAVIKANTGATHYSMYTHYRFVKRNLYSDMKEINFCNTYQNIHGMEVLAQQWVIYRLVLLLFSEPRG